MRSQTLDTRSNNALRRQIKRIRRMGCGFYTTKVFIFGAEQNQMPKIAFRMNLDGIILCVKSGRAIPSTDTISMFS